MIAPWFPSAHAVERWIQRWRPELSRTWVQAMGELTRLLAQSAFVEPDGDSSIWRLPEREPPVPWVPDPIAPLVTVDREGCAKTVFPPYAARTVRRPDRATSCWHPPHRRGTRGGLPPGCDVCMQCGAVVPKARTR